MSADSLTALSRAFFERTKLKLTLSIVISAFGLMLLGFTAMSGGLAQSNNQLSKQKSLTVGNDDYAKQSYVSLAGGYGFASFAYIIGFIMFVVAAVYASPLIFGSANEKKMLRTPQELEGSYQEYDKSSEV